MELTPNVLGRLASGPDPDLDVLSAETLTPERFATEYVDRCRPCVIRGAVRHWPACQRWKDLDYLRRALAGVELDGVRTQPEIELRWRERWGGRFAAELRKEGGRRFSLASDVFLRRIAALEFLFTYARDVRAGPLARLAGDVTDLAFLPDPPPPRGYARKRAFFFGRSYTDWHVHPVDETLMCQLGASKRVALLGPDRETWDAFMEVAREQLYIGAPAPERFPRFARLRPRVLVVHPGDATYIPPYWWHAVETLEHAAEPGATISYCWRSPPHIELDPRRASVQNQFRHAGLLGKAQCLWMMLSRWLPAHLGGRTL